MLRYIYFLEDFSFGSPGGKSSDLPPSAMTPQWTFRGRSTAEVLSSLELPDSTGKTYYGKAANSRGKPLATFSTGVTDSGESACFCQVSKLLFGVYPKTWGHTFSYLGFSQLLLLEMSARGAELGGMTCCCQVYFFGTSPSRKTVRHNN